MSHAMISLLSLIIVQKKIRRPACHIQQHFLAPPLMVRNKFEFPAWITAGGPVRGSRPAKSAAVFEFCTISASGAFGGTGEGICRCLFNILRE